MPVVEDPSRVRGRLLLDAAGDVMGRFEQGESDGQPLADLLAPVPGVAPRRAAAAAIAELKGWRVAADEPFGRILVAGALARAVTPTR